MQHGPRGRVYPLTRCVTGLFFVSPDPTVLASRALSSSQLLPGFPSFQHYLGMHIVFHYGPIMPRHTLGKSRHDSGLECGVILAMIPSDICKQAPSDKRGTHRTRSGCDSRDYRSLILSRDYLWNQCEPWVYSPLLTVSSPVPTGHEPAPSAPNAEQPAS